MYEILKVGGD